jgi:hypothetical protein
MELNIAELTSLQGNVKELVTPSGFTVVIREQNGDDDGILSNASLTKDSTSINHFIQGVIVWSEVGDNSNGTYSDQGLLNMRLGDKYAILLASRIFSLGAIVKFEYVWDQSHPSVSYEEDLNKFLLDYSQPPPKASDPGYQGDCIKHYPMGMDTTQVVKVLESGKKVSFRFLDGVGERYLMKLPEFALNANSRILARGFALEVGSNWVPVETFKSFSSKEMASIRAWIEELDPQFDGIVEVENPFERNQKASLSLLGINDFFFPREI